MTDEPKARTYHRQAQAAAELAKLKQGG
jgi:hypothetical protein